MTRETAERCEFIHKLNVQRSQFGNAGGWKERNESSEQRRPPRRRRRCKNIKVMHSLSRHNLPNKLFEMFEWMPRGHIRLLTWALALFFFLRAQHQLYDQCNCCCSMLPLAIAIVFVVSICVDDCICCVVCVCVRVCCALNPQTSRHTFSMKRPVPIHHTQSHMVPTTLAEFSYKYGANSVVKSFQSFISSSQVNPTLNSSFAPQFDYQTTKPKIWWAKNIVNSLNWSKS